MKCKIFKVQNSAKVLVIENVEFVEYYLQINSSDWFFCVGCKDNFDDITQEDAESIADEYYELCEEEEQVLEEHCDAVIEEIFN